MKKYDLINTVSRGSNARKEINPQLIVETNGNYDPGQIFDANATIKLVQDGISSFIGDAPDTLDTLEEITAKIQELDDIGFSDVALSGDYNDLTNTPTIPDAQIQSDWNQTDNTAKDYIKNKPTIPTVPTNVSSFTNDAGYLTSHQDISGKQNVIDTTHKLSADLIEDGTTNKVINVKPDWDAASGSSAEILNKPTIPTVPTNVSTFTNDAGYLTGHQDISGKEDVTAIVAPVNATDATLPITTLTTEAGKYYRIDVAVETIAVTLPAMTDVTKVKTIVLYLTGGTTPAVTISSTAPSGGTAPAVYFSDGYAIESGNTYEVNCAWNGLAWIVASFKINTSNS